MAVVGVAGVAVEAGVVLALGALVLAQADPGMISRTQRAPLALKAPAEVASINLTPAVSICRSLPIARSVSRRLGR